MPKAVKLKVVVDWERKLSEFLQEAIESPEREPEICERLTKFVQFLVERDRVSSLRVLNRLLVRHV